MPPPYKLQLKFAMHLLNSDNAQNHAFVSNFQRPRLQECHEKACAFYFLWVRELKGFPLGEIICRAVVSSVAHPPPIPQDVTRRTVIVDEDPIASGSAGNVYVGYLRAAKGGIEVKVTKNRRYPRFRFLNLDSSRWL